MDVLASKLIRSASRNHCFAPQSQDLKIAKIVCSVRDFGNPQEDIFTAVKIHQGLECSHDLCSGCGEAGQEQSVEEPG